MIGGHVRGGRARPVEAPRMSGPSYGKAGGIARCGSWGVSQYLNGLKRTMVEAIEGQLADKITAVKTAVVPSYLEPYASATRQFGSGFSSLLWASPKTQRMRFEAIRRIEDLSGQFVLDVGCGRGDLLEYLVTNGSQPSRYVGIEAMEELAEALRMKRIDGASVVEGDFVREPSLMDVGAEVAIFSGSLNTLSPQQFYNTLRAALAAVGRGLVFNFLSSPGLAGKQYLHWHYQADVMAFCRSLSNDVSVLADYLEGDCTVCVRKDGRRVPER